MSGSPWASAPAAARAAFAGGDVADEAVRRGLVRTAVDRFGGLDILVNNAGIYTRASIATATVAFWDRMMAINLRAPFILTQAAIEPMRARGGGSIVNIGSINAYVGMETLGPLGVEGRADDADPQRGPGALAASHPHQPAQRRLDSHRGRGPRQARGGGPAGELGRGRRQDTRVRPILSPHDIAKAAAFLASDDSALITGSVLDVEQFAIGAPGTW